MNQNSNFDKFLNETIAPASSEIDSGVEAMRDYLDKLIAIIRQTNGSAAVSNEQCEKIFGASTALAFTLIQHLAVVERMSDLETWRESNSDLWMKLRDYEILCGLATTHLARAGGGSISSEKVVGGFLVFRTCTLALRFQDFSKTPHRL